MASTASTDYVGVLYSAVLLRSASVDETSAWSALLDAGTLTQQQVTADIELSPEAVNFVDPVARLYQGFFDRAPDAAGFQGWVDALRAGTVSLTQIANGFVGSAEFQNIFGAHPDPTTFVTALYHNVLGRAPDAAGLTAWVGAITSGQLSFAQVALGFTQSPEFIADSTPAINNWLTTANAWAQAEISPLYLGGPIAGAVPSAHGFNLTLGSQSTTGSGLGGDTVYAPILDYTFGGATGQAATLSNGTSITLSGTGNTLDATLLGTATALSPTISGVQTLNLTNLDTAQGTATINAGKVAGVTTIDDLNSTAPIVVGTAGNALPNAVASVTIANPGQVGGSLTLDIAAASLAGNTDTLNINLVGTATAGASSLSFLDAGPDSGSNVYETFAISTTGNNVLLLSPYSTASGGISSATTITISGSGSLALGGAEGAQSAQWDNIKTIDASANSGGVSVVGEATNDSNSVAGITASDMGLTTVKGGAGDDVFDLSDLATPAQVNAISTLNGGGGTNEVYLSSGVIEGTEPLITMTNFQLVVEVNPGSNGGLVNWSNMGPSATTLIFDGAQTSAMTVQNAPNGFTLNEESFGAATQGIAIAGPSGTTDSLSVVLGTSSTPGMADASGALTVNGFETITITPRGGVDSVAGLMATASVGSGETLIVNGSFEVDFNGTVNLSGTGTTIAITDSAPVIFGGPVSATNVNASTSGGIFMDGLDTLVNGSAGDTIVGSATAQNQLFGSLGNDVITGGGKGDVILTVGGADTINLGTPGAHDEVDIGTKALNGNSVPAAIVAANSNDDAEPGYWGVAPNGTPTPQGGVGPNAGTSLDQSVITSFQPGSAATADSVAFRVAEWGTTPTNLGLVGGNLATSVGGTSSGLHMTPGVVHPNGTLSAATNLIELTDATFANANAMVVALHGPAYTINFAAALAAPGDFAHMLVAYNDPAGNAHIADLDITGAASASSMVLTLRASDMVELVGVSVQSLQPNNAIFYN